MAQLADQVRSVELPPAGTYDLDITHTQLEFVARHMLSKVRGRFTDFSGVVVIGDAPETSSARVEVETASIVTHTEQRDQHLKSADFLNVEEYPSLTFTSTGVRVTGERVFELDGELTIRGVTRPVTLTGEYLGVGTSPYGQTVFAATAATSIEREDWDMTWNVAIETGGWLVSKKVDIEIEVEAVLRQDG
ncbi:MAG TPA: YceI family protein [Actinomycetota bacterium]|nr:YceI family protein [Actinomycetota bacterium]